MTSQKKSDRDETGAATVDRKPNQPQLSGGANVVPIPDKPRVLPTLNKPIGAPIVDHSRDSTREDRRELARDTARAIEGLCSIPDFHPDLEALTIKVADGVARSLEKIMDNLMTSGQQLAAELKVAYREYEDNEIGIVQIERLERRLEGMRTQYAVAKVMFEGALNARSAIAGRLPFEWPSYRTMTEMKQANMVKRRMRESVKEATRLIGTSEAEYRRRLVEVKETPLLTNGVETDDGHGASRADVEQRSRTAMEIAMDEARKARKG